MLYLMRLGFIQRLNRIKKKKHTLFLWVRTLTGDAMHCS